MSSSDDMDDDDEAQADFVPLGSYSVGIEVDSLQAFLESNGIMCFQRGGQLAATLRYGFYEVRLEVRRSDLDKARELETAFNQGLPGYPFRDGGEGPGGAREGDEGNDDDGHPGDSYTSSKVEHEYAAPEPALDARKVSQRALVPGFGAASFAAGQRVGGVVVALSELAGLGLLLSAHFLSGAIGLVGGVLLDFFGSRHAVYLHNELQRRRTERRATDGHLLGAQVTMLDVALASCLTLPEADPDEVLLVEALRARGIAVEVWAWDDPTRDWAGARRVVLRSTWNYVHHAPAFLAWVDHVARVSVLDNPAPVVRWNWHKGYLLELAARGVPVTPTQLLHQGDSRGLEVVAGDWDEVVVKPAVSAGSFATLRARRGSPSWDVAAAHLGQLLGGRDMLVQAFLPAVEGHGERALVHIDGVVTHAVRKQPRFAGDDESVSAAVAALPEEAALAARVLAATAAALGLPAAQALLYARCDVAPGPDGTPVLMELELIEPSLFLAEAPDALERLARAVEDRLARG